MENPPFEDVFPIQMGIFHCYVCLPEGNKKKRFFGYLETSCKVNFHQLETPKHQQKPVA